MSIFQLTIRQLLAGKRWLVLAALALFPSLLSLAERASAAEPVFLQDMFPAIMIGMIVPITALLLAGSIMANDIEEGTAVFTLTKPLSRIRILLERYGASALLAVIVSLLSANAAMVIQSGRADKLGSLMFAYSAAITFGAMMYSALFLALSFLTRRGIIVGLLYILVWESTLAGQFAGTRSLSVKEYILTIASSLDKSGMAHHSGTVMLSTALIFGTAILSLALFYSLTRLRSYEMKEQA